MVMTVGTEMAARCRGDARRFMQRTRLGWAVLGVARFAGGGGPRPSRPLQPEGPRPLRVGGFPPVRAPRDRHYTIGSAGNSLVLMKQKQQQGTTVYLYRAVAPGSQ